VIKKIAIVLKTINILKFKHYYMLFNIMETKLLILCNFSSHTRSPTLKRCVATGKIILHVIKLWRTWLVSHQSKWLHMISDIFAHINEVIHINRNISLLLWSTIKFNIHACNTSSKAIAFQKKIILVLSNLPLLMSVHLFK
jgi:hypothetical protein